MSAEENKALVRRWFEDLFNTGNLDVAEEIIAQDHALHDPNLPDLPSGPEGDKQIVNLYRSAFPDTRITVEGQMAEGGMVATRWVARGTHEGELMGIPASGNRAEVHGITVNRTSGGKIAETWSVYDVMGMMRQIGAIPSPEQAQAQGKTL